MPEWEWWVWAVLFVAAFFGGAMDAIAGGGTILTFPALVGLGIPPVQANVTSAFSLFPGSVGGALGFRQEVMETRQWWLKLIAPSLAGGISGAFLLLSLPSNIFAAIAPYLVLAATLLIALKEPVERLLPTGIQKEESGQRAIAAVVAQFIVSIYGGYFGAGLGILVLAVLGLVGLSDIRLANGMKNLLVIAIKGVAVVYFIFSGSILWQIAILMVIASVIGGYIAAAIGHRMREHVMRLIVVVIGIGMAIAMFARL